MSTGSWVSGWCRGISDEKISSSPGDVDGNVEGDHPGDMDVHDEDDGDGPGDVGDDGDGPDGVMFEAVS